MVVLETLHETKTIRTLQCAPKPPAHLCTSHIQRREGCGSCVPSYSGANDIYGAAPGHQHAERAVGSRVHRCLPVMADGLSSGRAAPREGRAARPTHYHTIPNHFFFKCYMGDSSPSTQARTKRARSSVIRLKNEASARQGPPADERIEKPPPPLDCRAEFATRATCMRGSSNEGRLQPCEPSPGHSSTQTIAPSYATGGAAPLGGPALPRRETQSPQIKR